MVLNSVPRQALLVILMAVMFKLVAAQLRAATIQWRPADPVHFDGRILFTYRMIWRRAEAFCDATTVSSGDVVRAFGDHDYATMSCRRGCSETVRVWFQCTDFSADENWSAGHGSNEINLSGVTSFEASTTATSWIIIVQWTSLHVTETRGAFCELRVKGNLSPRADNGRINSSPTTAVPPVVRLQHGVKHTISIPVSDADGDVVRCRWAEPALEECGEVCKNIPITLDEDNCRLTHNSDGNIEIGLYVIAIQVEDFVNASSMVAMSSVPVQFLVEVLDTSTSVITAPTFVGTTPADGSCISIESTYQQQIIARSGGDNVINSDILTISPPGLMRSAVTTDNTSQEWYINVTWTPSASQQGANIFCYTATDNFGPTSHRCIILVVGVQAPQLTSVALTSFKNVLFELALQYDQQIKRPNSTCFVSVFQDDGVKVLSVDVSTSTDAFYLSKTLTIATSTPFSADRMYYLILEQGVAVATAFCALGSPAVANPSEWPFEVTTDCPGSPVAPSFTNSFPPSPALTWSPSSAAWSFTYKVTLTNSSIIVPRQAGTIIQIPGLQAETQYTVEITAYPDSTLCPAQSTVFAFRTGQICQANEFLGGSPDACQPCPAMSSSPGGVVRICTCMYDYGRVNASDPSLPCVACPGPPLNPVLTNSVPPNVEVQWDQPATQHMWSFMYHIDWQNGTSAVGDTADTRAVLSGLEAVTQYEVTITAFTDSTLCAEQSVYFAFNTKQRCPGKGPQVENNPEIQPGSATVTWQAVQTSDPFLTTGMQYAVYSQCGSESSYQLVAEDIEGLSYTVIGLPAPAQCVLRVVAYHRYCLQDPDGPLHNYTRLFTTAIAAPERPLPPTVTVGTGAFTIHGLRPMSVVVEYVCNYTSATTGVTSQVRMKPSVTVKVRLTQVGEYIVQCAGVNGDNYQGAFSEPVSITVEPPESQEDSLRILVSASVAGVVASVILLAVLVGGVVLQTKMRKRKWERQGRVQMQRM